MKHENRIKIAKLKQRLLMRSAVSDVFGVSVSSRPRPERIAQAQAERPDFDDSVNPNVREFWSTIRNPDSTYKERVRKHPFYALYGEELSKSGYGNYRDLNMDPMETMGVVQEIMESEQEYETYLENLAVKIVSEIWDCPPEILEAHLGTPPTTPFEDDGDAEQVEGEPAVSLDDEAMRHQIDKRITMNTLTHGAAVHQMQTAHHIARKQIDAFDDELVDLYDQVAKAAHKNYWQFFLGRGDSAQMAGSEEVQWDDEGEAKVVAYGMIFPVLLQELSKGVMELLTSHGLSDLDPNTQQRVIEEADRLDEEQWLIQVGPELWKRFLQVVPRDVPLGSLIMQFSVAEPQEVQEVLEAVIDNPERAREILAHVAGRLNNEE